MTWGRGKNEHAEDIINDFNYGIGVKKLAIHYVLSLDSIYRIIRNLDKKNKTDYKLKYHKNYNAYIRKLQEIFPLIHNIDVVFKHFEILKCITENKNLMCVEEISYEVDLSEQRIRVKLRELESCKFISSKTFKRKNTTFCKKYYHVLLDKNFLEEFEKYLYCDKCGSHLGKFGGFIHDNEMSERMFKKVFCSSGCRNRWCYAQ